MDTVLPLYHDEYTRSQIQYFLDSLAQIHAEAKRLNSHAAWDHYFDSLESYRRATMYGPAGGERWDKRRPPGIGNHDRYSPGRP